MRYFELKVGFVTVLSISIFAFVLSCAESLDAPPDPLNDASITADDMPDPYIPEESGSFTKFEGYINKGTLPFKQKKQDALKEDERVHIYELEARKGMKISVTLVGLQQHGSFAPGLYLVEPNNSVAQKAFETVATEIKKPGTYRLLVSSYIRLSEKDTTSFPERTYELNAVCQNCDGKYRESIKPQKTD